MSPSRTPLRRREPTRFVATPSARARAGSSPPWCVCRWSLPSRPERGANSIGHLAALPDVANVTGGYFVDCREAVPNREAQDDAAARRLWQESLRLGGL